MATNCHIDDRQAKARTLNLIWLNRWNNKCGYRNMESERQILLPLVISNSVQSPPPILFLHHVSFVTEDLHQTI